MEAFEIIHTEDASLHKHQIVSFWEQYLHGTAPDRFEWLLKGNPAGPAIWCLALAKNSKELIGTVSIMPKIFFAKNKIIRAGIVGDFMVDKQHRVFGPMLHLQRYIIENFIKNKFDFLYTIPNTKSKAALERVGFHPLIFISTRVKILRSRKYLDKYMPAAAAIPFSFVIDILLKIISKETYIPKRLNAKIATLEDDSYESIWKKQKSEVSDRIVPEHSCEYIRWRLFQNPQYRVEVLKFETFSSQKVVGYVAFYIEKSRMIIYDLVFMDESSINGIFNSLIKTARKMKCEGIYLSDNERSTLIRKLRSFGFVDTKEKIEVYSSHSYPEGFEKIEFFPEQRNI